MRIEMSGQGNHPECICKDLVLQSPLPSLQTWAHPPPGNAVCPSLLSISVVNTATESTSRRQGFILLRVSCHNLSLKKVGAGPQVDTVKGRCLLTSLYGLLSLAS